MNKLFLFFISISFFSYGQEEVETIQLSKQENYVFQGSDQEIKDWYLYLDQSGIVFLANLSIPPKEVQAWFEKRKDSQTMYRGRINGLGIKTLILNRADDIESQLSFYVKLKAKDRIVLESMSDAITYTFLIIQ